MKTENLIYVLLGGGLVGFLGAISLHLVGTTINPYNVSWLFFWVFLGLYLIASVIAIIFNIDKEKTK